MDRELKEPTVSVCMICYNQARFIGKAVESVLEQEAPFPVEILIGDDASDDGTAEILKEFKRKYPDRIRLFLRTSNVGPTANAYTVLSSAKGKFIASLEGDDLWSDTGFLARYVSFLEEHEDYIAVTGRCLVVNEADEAVPEKNTFDGNDFWKYQKKEFALADFTQWRMPGHIAATVYRNFYRDGKHDYEVFRRFHRCVGDRTTLLQLVVRGKIYCTDETVMHYRLVEKRDGNNWMSEWKRKNLRFDEYRLICTLERYAWEEYGIRADMTDLKKSKLSAAAVVFMLHPDINNLAPLVKIIFYSGHPIYNMRTVFRAIRIKRYWIKKGKPEHRINPKLL